MLGNWCELMQIMAISPHCDSNSSLREEGDLRVDDLVSVEAALSPLAYQTYEPKWNWKQLGSQKGGGNSPNFPNFYHYYHRLEMSSEQR